MAKKATTRKAKSGKTKASPVRKKKAATKATATSKARPGAGSARAGKSKPAPRVAAPRLAVKKSPAAERANRGNTGGLIPPGGKGPVNGRRLATGDDERLSKTKLTDKELAEFRELLQEKRRELIGDMAHLRNDALRQGSSGEGGGSSSMPIHMADIGSDTWEQELTLGLIENERILLREIDAALARINDRTYGICLATNKPITKARLRAKPWAKYCIEYARKRELGLI